MIVTRVHVCMPKLSMVNKMLLSKLTKYMTLFPRSLSAKIYRPYIQFFYIGLAIHDFFCFQTALLPSSAHVLLMLLEH